MAAHPRVGGFAADFERHERTDTFYPFSGPIFSMQISFFPTVKNYVLMHSNRFGTLHNVTTEERGILRALPSTAAKVSLLFPRTMDFSAEEHGKGIESDRSERNIHLLLSIIKRAGTRSPKYRRSDWNSIGTVIPFDGSNLGAPNIRAHRVL